MGNIIIHPAWQIAERFVTSEAAFLNRRSFLRQMSFAGAAGLAAMPLAGCAKAETPGADSRTSRAAGAGAPAPTHPASRNQEVNPNWTFTHEKKPRRHKKFFEFTPSQDGYR